MNVGQSLRAHSCERGSVSEVIAHVESRRAKAVAQSLKAEPWTRSGQRLLAYGDSQARAATTSASTPVSRVGWITGANRGL